MENQIYWLLAAALGAIAFTSLMLIRANRIVLREMEHLSEQRSGLARKLITMQEEMFRSISRELHDEFGQMLTAVGAMLSRARRQHCPPELAADLDEIRAIAQDALEKTRSLTQTLHPSILDDGGLEEAIDWYLPVFEKQTGIHVALEKSGVSRATEEQLGDGMPIHVYRVLQESLNNLARHSRSISAWVRVRFSGESLELEVEDRGVGLEPEKGTNMHGMGMIAMRERAQLLSGKIEFLTTRERWNAGPAACADTGVVVGGEICMKLKSACCWLTTIRWCERDSGACWKTSRRLTWWARPQTASRPSSWPVRCAPT